MKKKLAIGCALSLAAFGIGSYVGSQSNFSAVAAGPAEHQEDLDLVLAQHGKQIGEIRTASIKNVPRSAIQGTSSTRVKFPTPPGGW